MEPEHAWFTHDRFGMYEQYAEYFRADLYDPREWAAAVSAGMQYVVLTTKHHEGFCLWDSAVTDYKIPNTSYGRDAVAEYTQASRHGGLKVGLYYSLIDWHHPDYPIDSTHPRRDDGDVAQQNAGRSMTRYREYLHTQVRERLTNYGAGASAVTAPSDTRYTQNGTRLYQRSARVSRVVQPPRTPYRHRSDQPDPLRPGNH